MDEHSQLSPSAQQRRISISAPHPSQETPHISHPPQPPTVPPPPQAPRPQAYPPTPATVSEITRPSPPSPPASMQTQVTRPPSAPQHPPSANQLTPCQQSEPLLTSQPLQYSPCIPVGFELNTNGYSGIPIINDFPPQTGPLPTYTHSVEWCSPSTQPPPPQLEPGDALFTSANISEDSSPSLSPSPSPPTRGVRLPTTRAPSPPPPSSAMFASITCSVDGLPPPPLQPPAMPCAMFTRIACSEEELLPPPPPPPPLQPEHMFTGIPYTYEATTSNIKCTSARDIFEFQSALFTRTSPDDCEHTNRIQHIESDNTNLMLEKQDRKVDVHPNIDHLDHLDEVDGAIFSRIPQRIDTFSASLGLHHPQPSDAALDEIDTGVWQHVSDIGRVTSNRVEDTDAISRGHSTFFIDLETCDPPDGDNVNSYLPNSSLPESKSASSRDVFGIDNSKYANVSNELHPEHDARFTQSDGNTFVTTEYLSKAGISNQRTNAGRESFSTKTSPHFDTPYTTEDFVKSELKSRGIGMRINYSMCDINNLDNIQPFRRIVASCNDVIMTNTDSSLLPSRLNLSTTRLSVHNAITNTLAPGEGLRRTQSEELKPTSSSECQLHTVKSIESDRLLVLGSKCPEEMHRLSISLSNFTAHESHLRDTYLIPEIKLEHTEQVNSKPQETAHLIAGPERSTCSSLTESNVAMLGDASLNVNGTDSSGFDFEKGNDDKRIIVGGWERINTDVMPKVDGKRETMWNLMKAYAVVVFAVASALLFLADIGTDLRLAGMYHHNGSYTLFSITLAFIIAPSILMGIVDISWIFLDRKSSNYEQGGRIWISVRLLFGLLSFGRVIRACAFIRHHVKSLRKGDNRAWHGKRALAEKRDYHMLDFINAFSECAPQLLVQLYLVYKFSLDLLVLERVVSLLSSWISIAWTYTAYNKCHRDALPNKNETTTLAFICLLLSLLPALAGRFICSALFMTYFDAWIPAALFGSHFVLMIFIIHYQDPSLLGTVTSKWGRTLYIVFFAYVSLFSFVNLREDRSRVRMTILYVLFYVETFVITALVYWRAGLVEYETSDSRTHRELCLIAVPVCAFLHIALLLLYYTVFHPTTGCLKRQPPNN